MESCEFVDCIRLAEFVCQCSGQRVKFCLEHLKIHSNDNGDHPISRNLKKVKKTDREIIKIKCTASLSKLHDIREQALKKSNKNIKIIMDRCSESLQVIRELENMYCLTLNYYESKDKTIADNKQFEEFLFKYSEDPNSIYTELLKMESEILLLLNIEERFDNKVLKYNELEENFEKIKAENEELNKIILELNSTMENKIAEILKECNFQTDKGYF